MSDGEKMIWAASYSAALMAGNRPELAASVATLHVRALRLVTVEEVEAITGKVGDPAATTAAIADMRGAPATRGCPDCYDGRRCPFCQQAVVKPHKMGCEHRHRSSAPRPCPSCGTDRYAQLRLE